MTEFHIIIDKYFNSDLAKELIRDCSHLNSHHYEITHENVLCANLFISVFEAGDKFECNYKEFGDNIDITSYVAQKYPWIYSILPYYCGVYNYYRNYAWKLLGQSGLPRYMLVEKFFSWVMYVGGKHAYDNIHCDEQIYDEIKSGDFSLKPFINYYLRFVKKDNIIILPKSQRIVELKNNSIEDLLSQGNLVLDQHATNCILAMEEALRILDEDEEV